MKLCKNYIDGAWVESISGKTADTLNPANGSVLAQMTVSGPEDVDLAVAAAKRSFYETREWRDMDSQTRSDILLKLADRMDADRDELARLDAVDMGKPLREAEGDVIAIGIMPGSSKLPTVECMTSTRALGRCILIPCTNRWEYAASSPRGTILF